MLSLGTQIGVPPPFPPVPVVPELEDPPPLPNGSQRSQISERRKGKQPTIGENAPTDKIEAAIANR
jgi:hypothetical protein